MIRLKLEGRHCGQSSSDACAYPTVGQFLGSKRGQYWVSDHGHATPDVLNRQRVGQRSRTKIFPPRLFENAVKSPAKDSAFETCRLNCARLSSPPAINLVSSLTCIAYSIRVCPRSAALPSPRIHAVAFTRKGYRPGCLDAITALYQCPHRIGESAGIRSIGRICAYNSSCLKIKWWPTSGKVPGPIIPHRWDGQARYCEP